MRSSVLKSLITGVAAVFLLSSCEKEAGEGGNSSIKGYIHVTDYDAFLINVQGEYPGADEDVYIIYGNDISYGDRIKAGPDGVFEFKYLREGDYKVYVYSADTSLAGKVAIMKSVSITGKKQTLDAGTFDIKKK